MTQFGPRNNPFSPLQSYNRTLRVYIRYIRVIPQGTVDNNLGPDRLAGPKVLDPNYCSLHKIQNYVSMGIGGGGDEAPLAIGGKCPEIL